MSGSTIILFDGVCTLCNGAVNFIIKRDKKSLVKFASLQSERGQQLLQHFNLSTITFNSFILIENGIVFSQSTAALKLCRYLTGLWPLFYGFIIVPEFIRNAIYRWIAKNRYKWFGTQQQCMIPSEGLKNRFLQ